MLIFKYVGIPPKRSNDKKNITHTLAKLQNKNQVYVDKYYTLHYNHYLQHCDKLKYRSRGRR